MIGVFSVKILMSMLAYIFRKPEKQLAVEQALKNKVLQFVYKIEHM